MFQSLSVIGLSYAPVPFLWRPSFQKAEGDTNQPRSTIWLVSLFPRKARPVPYFLLPLTSLKIVALFFWRLHRGDTEFISPNIEHVPFARPQCKSLDPYDHTFQTNPASPGFFSPVGPPADTFAKLIKVARFPGRTLHLLMSAVSYLVSRTSPAALQVLLSKAHPSC